MKIAIVSDDFPPRSFGGAGIIAFSHAKELARRGHEVIVITSVQDIKLEGERIEDGVYIYNIYVRYNLKWRDYISLYNPQAVQKVKPILEGFKPDVTHIHNIHVHLSYYTFSLAKRLSKSVFFTAHDSMSVHVGKILPKITTSSMGQIIFDYRVSKLETIKHYGLRYNLLRKVFIGYFLNKANRIFSVSSALRDALVQNGIKGVEVMHNGIDAEAFRASMEDVSSFKKEYALENKKILFFGGRISRMKGGDVAFNLLLELSKLIPDICLLVIGEGGEYMNELKNKALSANILDKIRFIQWLDRDKIPVAYYASDIMLVPSLYLDPFPTVNLEAMAAGKPVLGTCFGGTSEAVKDGVTGYIVNPNDKEEVVQKTRALLEDQNLAEAFGKAGRELVEKEFSIARQVDRLENAYQKNK